MDGGEGIAGKGRERSRELNAQHSLTAAAAGDGRVIPCRLSDARCSHTHAHLYTGSSGRSGRHGCSGERDDGLDEERAGRGETGKQEE